MTITTLRPTSDSYRQGITLSTGSAMWSLLDDAPDDATYLTAGTNVQYPAAFFHLHTADTLTLTADQRVLACRIRVRIRMNTLASGVAAAVKMAFRGAYDGNVDYTEWFATAGTGVVEQSGVWRKSPPKDKAGHWGTEWTEFAVDAMQIHGQFFFAWNTKTNLRLTEIYQDVDVRDRPVITGAPAVAGATSTTSPTVSWVYTANADGDPQIAYRIKVFNSAQYGAAGFSADTSTPVWDSGHVSGTADNAQIGVALSNGVTYKAYVAGAQDFNGARWYSAWAVSGAFTIALNPPPVPTLAVTSDATVPGLRNFLAVQAHLNLLTANDASMDTTIGGWVQDAVATVVRDVAPTPAYGLGLMKLTASSAATMSARTAVGTSGYKVEAGQSYTALASFRTAVTARSCSVGLGFYNRAGTIIGAVAYGSTVSDAVGAWTGNATYTVAAPSNAVYAAVFVRVASPANAEVHYVDKVMLATSGASGWSPGGQSGVASTVIERNLATASPRNLIHQQLWSGGDYLKSRAGFFASGTNSRPVFDPSERHLGGGSIRWDVNDAASKLYFGWDSAAAEDLAPTYPLAAVPGSTYTFGVYAKSTAAFSTVLNLQALDATGTAVGSPVASSGISLTTGWVLYQVSITVPAGGVYVRPHFDNTGTVTERFVWVDSAQWVLGSAALTAPGKGMGLPTVWRAARGAGVGELVIPADPGDLTWVVVDDEVPPGFIVTYRAYNVMPGDTVSDVSASAPTPYVQTRMAPPGPGYWVLKDPTLSSRAMRVHVVGMSGQQEETADTYRPLRPDAGDGLPGQRAVTVSDGIGGHDGSIDVLCDSEQEWLELGDLLAAQRALWLVFPHFGGRHVRFLSSGWDMTSQRTGTGDDSVWRRTLKLPFLHTDGNG